MYNANSLKIMSIVGARPNFMKIAPIARAVEQHNACPGSLPIDHVVVHTGQHYDDKMSDLFFKELEIPRPDYNLHVGSASHAVQTAQIMERFEPVLLREHPDVLLVVGDVNSTVACALVATKINYNGSSSQRRPLIAHIEAGLRSRDRDMPEEINRILTDALSDLLFVTEEDALESLEREGIPRTRVHFVGNVMIDTLMQHREKAHMRNTLGRIVKDHELAVGVRTGLGPETVPGNGRYGVVTLHRPSNVDTPAALNPLINNLARISTQLPLIFPVHPRTRANMEKFGMVGVLDPARVIMTEPLGYLDFLSLVLGASLVLTDSGGIQEETTFLDVPCITLRNNTERHITVTRGTNYLVGTNPEQMRKTALDIIAGRRKKGTVPMLWDGMASNRIIEVVSHRMADLCAA